MQTGRWLASAMAVVVTVGALSALVVSAQSRQSRQ
jgi:hypothetical protein